MELRTTRFCGFKRTYFKSKRINPEVNVRLVFRIIPDKNETFFKKAGVGNIDIKTRGFVRSRHLAYYFEFTETPLIILS